MSIPNPPAILTIIGWGSAKAGAAGALTFGATWVYAQSVPCVEYVNRATQATTMTLIAGGQQYGGGTPSILRECARHANVGIVSAGAAPFLYGFLVAIIVAAIDLGPKLFK